MQDAFLKIDGNITTEMVHLANNGRYGIDCGADDEMMHDL